MFILSNLVSAFASVLQFALMAYWWVVIVKCLLSFVNPDPNNQVVIAIDRITDPVLSRIRKSMPFVMQSGFDLSPIVVLLAITFLLKAVVNSLFDFAMIMK